jgi:glycosyltransferase involved in cell wall biosynthesis
VAIKIAHVWSSDMGMAASLPQLGPFLREPWRLYAICPDGPRLESVRRAGITWLPMSLSRRLVDPVGDVRAAVEILAHCVRERFDIVHTHNIKAGLLGRVMAGAARTPRILHTMHGMPFDRSTSAPRRLGHVALEWVACRFADRILVQSEEDEKTLLDYRVVPPSRLVRIGNGVPLWRFDPGRLGEARARERVRAELGLAGEDVLFVSAGRLVREKGVVELGEATALARARDPRIRVAVCAPLDPEKADCLTPTELAAAEAAGVGFLGERSDMPDILAAADVAVLPSWREGLPRFLMEAAAMGKPLLATDVRGNREIVDRLGGELVPVRAPGVLAGAMLRFAADAAGRARMGAWNRARALREYDVDTVVARVERVYRDLVS